MNGKVRAAVLIAAVILISAVVSFISAVVITGRSDRVFPGITAGGLDIGNMTRTEAGRILEEHGDFLRGKTVTARFDGGNGSFKLSAADLKVNARSTVDKAISVGRRGNFLEQWRERRSVAKTGHEVSLDFSVSKEKLRVVLDDLTREIRIPPRDAKLIITPEDAVTIVESSTGRGVDLETAYNDLRRIIANAGELEMELRIVQLQPAKTTEEIGNMRVNGVLAQYSTRFDIKKTNRVYNIRVAAGALDGQIIKSGETFSFNKVVGPRSQEAGYKLAPTILNNEFIDTLGGGVCQVSTTLYNTLLLADVEVLERSSHSLVIKYVPLGQDAAVAFNGKDLKFRNNLPCAMIIKTAVHGDTVTFKLFGDTSLRKSVQIINKVIKDYPFKIVYKDDATLAKGKTVVDQKGTQGYRVTSSMIVSQDGKVIAKKNLPSSFYAPLDQIVLVGTLPAYAGSMPDDHTGGGTQLPVTEDPPVNPGGAVPVSPSPTEPPPVVSPPGLPPDENEPAPGQNSG